VAILYSCSPLQFWPQQSRQGKGRGGRSPASPALMWKGDSVTASNGDRCFM